MDKTDKYIKTHKKVLLMWERELIREYVASRLAKEDNPAVSSAMALSRYVTANQIAYFIEIMMRRRGLLFVPDEQHNTVSISSRVRFQEDAMEKLVETIDIEKPELISYADTRVDTEVCLAELPVRGVCYIYRNRKEFTIRIDSSAIGYMQSNKYWAFARSVFLTDKGTDLVLQYTRTLNKISRHFSVQPEKYAACLDIPEYFVPEKGYFGAGDIKSQTRNVLNNIKGNLGLDSVYKITEHRVQKVLDKLDLCIEQSKGLSAFVTKRKQLLTDEGVAELKYQYYKRIFTKIKVTPTVMDKAIWSFAWVEPKRILELLRKGII